MKMPLFHQSKQPKLSIPKPICTEIVMKIT